MKPLPPPSRLAGWLFLGLFQLAVLGQTFEVSDAVLGDYDGVWSARDGQKGRALGQIRSLGNGQYDGFVVLERGRKQVAMFRLASSEGNAESGLKLVSGPVPHRRGGELLPQLDAQAAIRESTLRGTFAGDLGGGVFDTKRVQHISPSEGAKPPTGGQILFGGKASDQWISFPWRILSDGSMESRGENLVARDRMTDFRLHVEFRLPHLPNERGGQRANAGVYLQSLYEVQILDSFGLPIPQMGDCGGISGVKGPEKNVCLPPGRWQTFDITYHEQKTKGQVAAQPLITVVHNGVMVQKSVRIPDAQIGKGTGGANPGGGFLMLAYQGQPVQFRNIWVLPLRSQ